MCCRLPNMFRRRLRRHHPAGLSDRDRLLAWATSARLGLVALTQRARIAAAEAELGIKPRQW